MRSRPWIVLLAAAAFAGGCGDDPTLGTASADELRGQVAAAREAAGEGDRAGVLEALDRLEADVEDLEAGGSLAEADASALRRGIGRARRRAREEIAEPTPAATETPAPEPTAAPEPTEEPEAPEPGGGNDEQKGKGETEGKGQEKKDDKEGKE